MKNMPDEIMRFQTNYILSHQQVIMDHLPDPDDKGEYYPIVNYIKKYESMIYDDDDKLCIPAMSKYHN